MQRARSCDGARRDRADRGEITHVYLHGAAALRRDLSHVYAVPDEPRRRPQDSRDPTPPRRVLVTGAGLMGTSVALALPGRASRCSSRTSTCTPTRCRVPGSRRSGPDPATTGPDLVVVGVPPTALAGSSPTPWTCSGRDRHRSRQRQGVGAEAAAGRARTCWTATRRPPDGRQRAVGPLAARADLFERRAGR